jgi:hypothetical protein
MKRIGLLLLAVALLGAAAACGNKDVESNPVGRWAGTFDWGAGPGNMDMHIYADNTAFLKDWGLHGRWNTQGARIVMDFSTGATYLGTIVGGSYMTGTMNTKDGKSGTWSAKKISDVP